jgi:hypothetical protein
LKQVPVIPAPGQALAEYTWPTGALDGVLNVTVNAVVLLVASAVMVGRLSCSVATDEPAWADVEVRYPVDAIAVTVT